MSRLIESYRMGISKLIGSRYAELAAAGLRRAIIGFIVTVLIVVVDIAALLTTSIANSATGTLIGVSVTGAAVIVLFSLGARWNAVSYTIRRELRAAGFRVRQPADIRGVGTLRAWLSREGLTAEQVIAISDATQDDATSRRK